eukprot:10445025-Ditylum_brightwellii.AAC.1
MLWHASLYLIALDSTYYLIYCSANMTNVLALSKKVKAEPGTKNNNDGHQAWLQKKNFRRPILRRENLKERPLN